MVLMFIRHESILLIEYFYSVSYAFVSDIFDKYQKHALEAVGATGICQTTSRFDTRIEITL
jgi:hypothetical protein